MTHQKRSKIVVIVGAAATILGATPLAAVAGPSPKTPALRADTLPAQQLQAGILKSDSSVARKLAAKAAPGSCAVIVKIDGDLSPARQARLAALGGDVTRHLGFIHSVALTLPIRSLEKLAALPFVTHLSYDGAVKKCDLFTDASSGAAAARQQYGLTGQGVGVAVVDSGVECTHWDFLDANKNSHVVASPDFTSSPQTTTASGGVTYIDYCGHGTHVAGIIAGNGAASTGAQCTHTYYGVAPQAKLVSVRVLDQNGASNVATVLAGLQWVLNNQAAYNIRVVNLSLGHPVGESYTTDPLCQAVETLWKAGIVVVCAAGNDGRASATYTAGAANEGWGTAYGSIQSPANDPYVITVGATKNMDGNRSDDRLATYSGRGPSRLDLILKPDIVAPGNKVISLDVDWSALSYAYASTNLLPYSAYTNAAASGTAGAAGASNRAGAGDSNAYFVLSGTSMAAPVVSGAAALMLQEDPSLTPDTVKARLMVAADKWAFPVGSYEAESSANTRTGSAAVYSNSCFSGGGDVHYIGGSGTLQFNQVAAPSAGAYTLTVAYVNGDSSARTVQVSVNGGSPQAVSCAPLGNWWSYQIGTVDVPVTLRAGANTIKFSNPSGNAPDIDRIGLTQPDPLSFGAGYLNIPAALASTLTVTQHALSPALKIDSYGNVSIDTTVIASKAVSGVSTIWGSKAVSGVSTIYGSKAVSGVSTVSSSKAVSGSSVWGDKTVCGASSPAVDLSSVAAHGE